MQKTKGNNQAPRPGTIKHDQGQWAENAQYGIAPARRSDQSGDSAPRLPGMTIVKPQEAVAMRHAARQEDGLEGIHQDRHDQHQADQSNAESHYRLHFVTELPRLFSPQQG